MCPVGVRLWGQDAVGTTSADEADLSVHFRDCCCRSTAVVPGKFTARWLIRVISAGERP
jgi:hypothetical protein